MSTPNRGDLREALKRVASALKQGGVPFALAGSYALWAQGAPEGEHDVDFVVPEHEAERAAHALAEAGLEVVRPPEDWLFKVGTDGVVVDVLHRISGEPATADHLERTVETEVLSVRMPVLAATDIVASKLRAMTEHYCDFGALLPAVRAVREKLDWDDLAKASVGNDFAVAFLFLTGRLGISDPTLVG